MKNILVVDNDRIFLTFMQRLLEKEGHQVKTANDGLNALDILKTYTPDVMFVDLVMPNIDGRTLCRIIRGKEKFKNTPIIILSATSAEELTDFSQLDVNACIAKGTFNETAQHVLSVLNKPDLASCRYFPGDVVGIKDVYPRGITKELLSVKKHFEVMLDRMSEGILEINWEGKIVYVNSAAFSMIDSPQTDLLGLYFVDLFSGYDHQRVSDLIKIKTTESKTITDDAPVRLKKSLVTLNIIFLGEDEDTSIIILNDITERKKSEEALRKSEERHRLSLGVSPDPIVLYDMEGRATYVNPAFEQTFGWSLAEIEGKRIDFVPKENWPETEKTIDRMLGGEKVKLFETKRSTKGGDILDIQLSTSLFRDRDDKPAGSIVIFRDITALKQAERALQKAHDELEQRVEERTFELLRVNKQLEKEIRERKRAEQEIKVAREYTQGIIDCSLDMIISVDNERRIVEFNAAAEKNFGYRKEEVLGEKVDFLYADPEEGESIHETVRKTGEFVGEITNMKKNKTAFRCLLSATLLRDASGRIIGNMGISKDIEEQKQAERTLYFTQFAVDHSSDAAFWMDPEARFVYVNESACRTLGYSQAELSKMTVHDIDPDFTKKVWSGHWEDVKNRGSFVLESRHRAKDGKVFPVEISVNYMKFEGREYNCTFARDISERKKIEQAIQLAKTEWVSTFDAISDWVSLINLEYKIMRSNRAGEKFLKISTEETIGQSCCNLLHGMAEPIPGCPMQKMLETHQRESLDFYNEKMKRWLRVFVDPLTDASGNIVRAVHIVRDITDRKRVEQEREKLINELQEALKEIKTLRGILPLCSFCKKIRDDKGYWEQVDVYIDKYSQADISHSICPECAKEHYPDLDI